MRKKRTGVTQEDVQRWVKAWKKACAKKYRSFDSVADVPSKGRAHENADINECDKKIVQHSDLEYNYTLLARFHPYTSSIKTQEPLIDLENDVLPQTPTIEIEQAMDITEARFRGTTTNWIYKGDAVVTQNINDKEITLARSMKYLKDLVFFDTDSKTRTQEKKRTWELLNVERVFFESRGINWKIITERSINRNAIDNIERMLQYVDKTSNDNEQLDLTLVCFKAVHKKFKNKEALEEVLFNTASFSGLSYEDTVAIFWQLCWHKKIKFDIKKERLEMNSIITTTTFFTF